MTSQLMNIANKSLLLYGCNGEVSHLEHRSESLFMGVVMLLMILISLFGNSLVILSIYRFEKLRNITNTLLCSLAVSDLLSPVFRVTFIAISNLSDRWAFGCLWCEASSQIGIFFCAASIAHLCVITLERYIKIVHPYRHNMWLSKRAAHITVFMIWLISVGLAVLPFIFKSKIDIRFNRNLLYCEVYLVRNPYLSVIMSAIFFAIPFLVMCVAYYHIFIVAHKQNKKMSVCSIGDKATKSKRLMKQELKAVKTVVIVVGVFFILWSPYFIYAIVQAYHPDQPYWVSRFAICCAYLNTCCNWIVYCVLNKELRTCFMKILNIDSKRVIKKDKAEKKREISDVTQRNTRYNGAYDTTNDVTDDATQRNTSSNDISYLDPNAIRSTSEIIPSGNYLTTLPDWQRQSIQRMNVTSECNNNNFIGASESKDNVTTTSSSENGSERIHSPDCNDDLLETEENDGDKQNEKNECISDNLFLEVNNNGDNNRSTELENNSTE